jgi:hypothetical protein
MSLKVEDAVSPPHLFQGRSATWPSSYNSQACSLGSSPAPKSPQPAHPYMDRMHESPMSSDNINSLPTSGWYDPSIMAPAYQVRLIYHSNLDWGLTQYLNSTPDMNITCLLTDPRISFLHPHLHSRKQGNCHHQQHKSTAQQE